jgi:protein-tyrosine phosphatase
MSSPLRILFVCMGNICRSPAGENVLRHLVEARGLNSQYVIDSAGTIGYHVGEAPDSRMSEAGKQRGIDFKGSSRQFSAADFENFDLIVTMDESNREGVLQLAKTPGDEGKVRSFCSFVSSHQDREVPDPYYGGSQGFEHVMDLMEDGCEGILKEFSSS